jgi:hypothetical protein
MGPILFVGVAVLVIVGLILLWVLTDTEDGPGPRW